MGIEEKQAGRSMRRSIAAFLVASTLSMATVATAETPESVATKAHLLGTWAIDCSKLPAPTNVYNSFYATSGGGVHFSQESGLVVGHIGATIEQVVALTPTTISMRLRNDDPIWKQIDRRVYDIVLEIEDDRAVVLQSALATGQAIFKDGQLVGLGTPAPVRQRCRPAKPMSL